MLEAASCGLLVVSTDVGGIPEVLPPGIAYLAKPDAKSLTEQLFEAIKVYDSISCQEMHQIVKDTYSWRYVAEQTEKVYDFAMQQPSMNTLEILKHALSWGPLVGCFAVVFQVLEWVLSCFYSWLMPEEEIDIVRNFNVRRYQVNP